MKRNGLDGFFKETRMVGTILLTAAVVVIANSGVAMAQTEGHFLNQIGQMAVTDAPKTILSIGSLVDEIHFYNPLKEISEVFFNFNRDREKPVKEIPVEEFKLQFETRFNKPFQPKLFRNFIVNNRVVFPQPTDNQLIDDGTLDRLHLTSGIFPDLEDLGRTNRQITEHYKKRGFESWRNRNLTRPELSGPGTVESSYKGPRAQ